MNTAYLKEQGITELQLYTAPEHSQPNGAGALPLAIPAHGL